MRRFSETAVAATRRWSTALLILFVCLIAAGCAQRDSSFDEHRQDGFYAGVSIGGDK